MSSGVEGAADYRDAPLPSPGGAAPPWPPWTEDDTGAEVRERRVDAALHGQRLDKALVVLAPEFSRSHLQTLIERGHVRLDGARADTASRRVRAGQQLRLELVPTDESRAFHPQAMPLVCLYEDEHLLVLDKPAGLVVHPAPGHWSGTLLNGLLAHHALAATLPRAGIVHRLDKDTSGLMLVGKTLPAVTALVRDIAARAVHRRYLALAHGRPAAAQFSVDAPVGRDPVQRVRMAVVPVPAGGRAARTDVQCLATLNLPATAGAGRDHRPGGRHGEDRIEVITALSCTLHTGRTHQIRVHLASRGHPLLGDSTYGGRPLLGLQRQALHATELGLLHPMTRAALRFECPPPSDLAAAWARVLGVDPA